MDKSRKYELTLSNLLRNAVERNPNQLISYRGKLNFTYREFLDRVEHLAKSLIRLGLQKGDKVAVIDWDTNRYLEAYYAIPMAGGVIHTVNIRYPPELIFYSMQHAEDKFVIVRDEFTSKLEPSKHLFDFIKLWIVYSESGKVSTTLEPFHNYDELMNGDNEVTLPNVMEDDPATIFYTSGTTGLPKGVSFTHRQLFLHTMALGSATNDEPIDATSDDVIMPLVPMFHVHSWGLPYFAIMRGMKYILPGKYDIGELLKIIEKEHVTLSAMVPTILYMLVSDPDASKILPKSKLRTLIGGGALSKGLAQNAKKMGIEAVSGYGMSETCPVLTLATFNVDVRKLPENEKEKYLTKTGVPIPMVSLRVVDKSGNDVPKDSTSIGEIIVQAPWLTKEYVKDPENTKKLWIGEWMHTGDLAVIDNFGYVSIVDREKDAVKSGGEFIPTLVLEDLMSTCEGVKEVAVVGKPDEQWGERPIAFIVSSPDLTKQKLMNHFDSLLKSGRIEKFWIPDDFIFVTELAKTSTGKVDKKPLKERAKSM
ncbi:MAG: fatty acid--CoA ligase [Thermoplasmataceae archaeon]|jgi:fatty-acyl-CoA synthase